MYSLQAKGFIFSGRRLNYIVYLPTMPCNNEQEQDVPQVHRTTSVKRWIWISLYFGALAYCIFQICCLHNEVHEMLNATTTDLQMYVDQAIAKYDADKTGLIDFAMKSAGGKVVSIKDTQPYVADWTYSCLGLYKCGTIVSPSKILQANSQPGECWPFVGSKGTAVIKLISPVEITGLTYEHVTKSLIINEDISSAPLEFTLKGLSDPEDSGFNFGKFVFDRDGPSIQYFPVQRSCDRPYEFAEFTVLSNHGNVNYTCLYRIRIHGKVRD